MQKLLIRIDKKAEASTSARQEQQPSLNEARIRSRQWDINEADTTVEIETYEGGEIGRFAKAKEEKNTGYIQRNPWLQKILLLVAVVVSVGFLATLIYGIFLGTVTFKIYMDYIIGFLAALGVGQFSKKFGKASE